MKGAVAYWKTDAKVTATSGLQLNSIMKILRRQPLELMRSHNCLKK